MATERRPGLSDEDYRTDDYRTVDEQYGSPGRALSRLCQTWVSAGTDFLVGSTRAVADALEDLSDVYCNSRRDQGPDGRPPRE
jgi:hypothetical protein